MRTVWIAPDRVIALDTVNTLIHSIDGILQYCNFINCSFYEKVSECDVIS